MLLRNRSMKTIQYQRQILRGNNFEADSPLWYEKPSKERLEKKVNVYGMKIRFVRITTIIEEISI